MWIHNYIVLMHFNTKARGLHLPKLNKAKYSFLKMLVTVVLKFLKKLKAVVNCFLINPCSYGKKKNKEKPKIISWREEENFKCLIEKQEMSSSQIQDEMLLACSSWTIRNALHKNFNVLHKHFKSKSSFAMRHVHSHLKFAQRWAVYYELIYNMQSNPSIMNLGYSENSDVVKFFNDPVQIPI